MPTEAQYRRQAEKLIGNLELADTSLVATINRNLGGRVWGGTTITDRLGHQAQKLQAGVAAEIEQALFSQDSYDEFESRMLGKLGIADDGASGPLADLELSLKNEARLAWNNALVGQSLNQAAMMVPVWAAILDDRTTPGCWRRHGRLINEELGGEVPQRHYGCRCRVINVPNPGAPRTDLVLDGMGKKYQDWAKLGRDLLAEMRRDRESGFPVAKEPKGLRESLPQLYRQSRFQIFREA